MKLYQIYFSLEVQELLVKIFFFLNNLIILDYQQLIDSGITHILTVADVPPVFPFVILFFFGKYLK